MFKVGEKVVYIKKLYNTIELNKNYTVKTFTSTSITLLEYHNNWHFSNSCFISLSEYRKLKLKKIHSCL